MKLSNNNKTAHKSLLGNLWVIITGLCLLSLAYVMLVSLSLYYRIVAKRIETDTSEILVQ